MNRSLLFLFLLFYLSQINAEIVGDNYFGRDLEVLFSSITGWKDGTDFRANTETILPSFIEFNDVIEFDCSKGADSTLISSASSHADISIRFCDKSIVLEKLKVIQSRTGSNTYHDPLLQQLNALQKIHHSTNSAFGMSFDNYQVPLIGIGHGFGINWLTITTSAEKSVAIITRINFYRDEKNCVAEVLCKFDGDLMIELNQHILREDKKYLEPTLNEIKSHFAYSVSVADWRKIGSLDDIEKRSGAIDLVRSHYPGLIIEGGLARPDLAGEIRNQGNGVFRAYVVLIVHFDETKYGTDAVAGAKKLMFSTFDSYMTSHLRNLSILHE